MNSLKPLLLKGENLKYQVRQLNPWTKLKAAKDSSTPFNVFPRGDTSPAIMAATPITVTNARSLNADKPNIVPSPANTKPFTKCINDDINAGPFTASRTSGRGENQGVIIGKANSWTPAKIIPSIVPHAKILSATGRAASSPSIALADGTNAAAVPCTPR